MHTLKKIMFLLVALALLCSSIPVAQAQDAPDAAPKLFLPLITAGTSSDSDTVDAAQAQLVTRKDISPSEQKAALAFWSRAAIAAAQPMPLLSQAGAAVVDTTALSKPAVTEPAGFAAAGAAAPGSARAAQAAYPLDWAALAESVEAADVIQPQGTSQTFTSYFANKLAALQTIFPHATVGRVTYSTPQGGFACSATSISGNVMLTAAHCVYDSTNNVWYSNWVFAPAYRNGAAPFGTFSATSCWVLNSWINLSGSYNINTWGPHDVAVCKMGKNSAGQTLNGAVGWLGRQWNWSYVRHFHSLGYPARNYNDVLVPEGGLYLHACIAESFQQATEVRGLGCDMGRGKSGGPWVNGYAPGVVTGAVDGVNSGLFIGTMNNYGARFNSNNIVPLCSAAAC